MSRAIQIQPLFSAEVVAARIDELASELHRDYGEGPISIVSIALGARRFTEALVEGFGRGGGHARVREIRAHRTEGTNLGALQIESLDPSEFDECDVLVVDDIADEGRTLRAVLDLLELSEFRSLRCAVLVNKLERRREPLTLDYVGFVVERGWVVGFGMDIDGELRDLDEIGVVFEETLPPPDGSA